MSSAPAHGKARQPDVSVSLIHICQEQCLDTESTVAFEEDKPTQTLPSASSGPSELALPFLDKRLSAVEP